MTAAEMGQYFDLLQDKFSSPYFTDAEKTVFLQRAQVGFVRDLLFPEERQDKVNLELSQDTLNQVNTLIRTLPYFNMSSNGLIPKTGVATALNTLSSGAVLWRPLSIGWTVGGDTRPVKFVRHNDIWEFKQNYFKNPSSLSPKWTEDGINYTIYPTYSGAKIYFTVLKYPTPIVVDSVTPANNVNSDLPDHTHDRVVALALEYAGVSSRDEALAQLLQIKR